MVDWTTKHSYDCKDLENIVRILRHPGGCPWDQEQTHRSIRRNFLEEVYEVAEAIDNEDVDGLKEELGDVLLQVYFHASIEEDAGRFTLDDVADGVCKKLIYRHPHVFGEVNVRSTDEVLSNWEELKKREKHQDTQADAVDAVARTLPALWRAEKVKKKAAKAGFDWADVSGALDKLSEELEELRTAALDGEGDPAEELGDLLLAAVSVGRYLGADPEEALHAACDKFSARFRKTEELAGASGQKMDELSEGELTALWREAKKQLDRHLQRHAAL
ncbi:MAG: nucleoside triphosphate pyrophosphohydrolase [Oscillospiraceae bacterium]|nr:nucleoside triphosphate pyrophosphohydrolase [Oscillospiraceae bacterium]MCI9308860.1 nucleoside triphosphate pyrophosphohydrolase [Oscillospiraceae bacterium]